MVFPTSDLSFENVLRDVHDPGTQSLRTSNSASVIVPGGIEIAIDHTEDSVALGDGSNLITSTQNGSKNSLDVNITNSSALSGSFDAYPVEKGTTKNIYNEITAVAQNTWVQVVSYTVPAGKNAFFARTEYSGTNIGTYEVSINGLVQDKKRTNYAVSLNDSSVFNSNGNSGIPLGVGDIVRVKVMHVNSNVGDFNARLEIIEV